MGERAGPATMASRGYRESEESEEGRSEGRKVERKGKGQRLP